MNARFLVKVGLVGMACILAAGGCRKTGAGAAGADGALAGDIIDYRGGGGGLDEFGLAGRDSWLGLEPLPGDYAPVYFDYDSSALAAGERAKVDPVIDVMSQSPQVYLTLEGHCDERGSREYNMSLGENRALAVRDYLMGRGVDSSRIQTISYGEENPVSMGHSESDYRLNRRVEFRLAQ